MEWTYGSSKSYRQTDKGNPVYPQLYESGGITSKIV